MTKRIDIIVASLMLIASIPCMAKASTKEYVDSSAEKSMSDSITVSGRFRNTTEWGTWFWSNYLIFKLR